MAEGVRRHKLIEGLRDAVEGRIARATFFGVDFASGVDLTTVLCPRCDAPNIWTRGSDPPKCCRDCGLEFRFRPATPSRDRGA